MWISYFKTQTSAPSTVDNLKALSGADFKINTELIHYWQILYLK